MPALKPAEVIRSFKQSPQAFDIALIHGAEHNAVRGLCQQLIAQILGPNFDPLNLVHLNEASQDFKQRFYEELFAGSLFGDKRLVWVSNAGETLAKQLEALLNEQRLGNFLLIDTEALPKTSKLRKLCEGHKNTASVALYEETAQELHQRLETMIRHAKLKITPEGLTRLLELTSADRGISESETDKLITYCLGNEIISRDDVEAVCGNSAEASYDELADAVFEGNLPLIDQLTINLASEIASRSPLSLMLQHVIKLQSLGLQIQAGNSIDATLGLPRNGVFFKRRPSFSRQLRRWTIENLCLAEEKIGAAILQTRQFPNLEAAVINRTLLALGHSARN